MTILRSLLLFVLLAYSATASGFRQPLNQGNSSVYSVITGEDTEMTYNIYKIANGWLISFIGASEKINTYREVARLGAKRELDVVITLDFEPPLNCTGEYDIVLGENNTPEETERGFEIPLSGSPDWKQLDFSRLMIYFDYQDPNTDRC